VCFGCCYEPTHNFSIDWAMGYIYFIIDLPSALVWDRRKKNADAVFGKASETVAGAWSGAGASAGAIHLRPRQ